MNSSTKTALQLVIQDAILGEVSRPHSAIQLHSILLASYPRGEKSEEEFLFLFFFFFLLSQPGRLFAIPFIKVDSNVSWRELIWNANTFVSNRLFPISCCNILE